MRDQIVITSNLIEGASMVDSLIKKPQRSDRMGLITGKWGHGKSTFMEWYFANNICFYARALASWSGSLCMMLEDLLRAYRVEAVGRIKADLRELVSVMRRHKAPLFIDEADRVVRKFLLVETIRDIHDMARTPVILIGQESMVSILQRKDLGPVFSRITELIEFKALSGPDIQEVAKVLCDLACSPKVAGFIRTATLGDFRLLNAVLTKAEGLCGMNKLTEITMQIAREAAKALPNPEGLRTLQVKEPPEEKPESLRAAA